MNDNSSKPILLFAYATEDLSIGVEEEASAINEELKIISRGPDRLCHVEIPRFVQSKDVIDIFQENRNRVSIFHYAGHADGAQLLLKTAQGMGAGAAGMAAAVRSQSGLKLVFLNGCSTEDQVEQWTSAGVPCVIATTRAINGQVAKDFAARFYKGLATGASIRTAYEEAVGEAVSNSNGNMRLLFAEEEEDEPIADHWPWFMRTTPGAEEVEDWNIPDAAGDPLALLPLPPGTGIPEDSPYPGLRRFTEKDAAAFFGRGQAVRKLYERVTSTTSAPIIMLHGQAGVGKSSILEAGLAPRLRAVYGEGLTYEVITIRIDPTRGLIDSFMLAFVEDAARDDGSMLSPAKAWKAKEARLGKALLVVLDQIEEAFTHAHIGASPDWDGFVESLSEVFGNPKQAPQGKLLLAFRTEWFSRVKKKLRGLQKSEVFLDSLDQSGIEEATLGPTLRRELREQFPLTIEGGLENKISNALLNSPNTSVAPTLQVLLKKLWDEANLLSRKPTFTDDLYRKHQASMGEFVEKQIGEIKSHPKLSSATRKAIEAGLLIDFLECHITPEMTSRQCTLKEFIEGDPTATPPVSPIYPDRKDVIEDLRKLCIDHYLLIQPDAGNNQEPEPASRLAHDSIAVHIHALYEASDAPGQRARRILEQRVREWDRLEQAKGNKPLTDRSVAPQQAAGAEHMTTQNIFSSFSSKFDTLSVIALEVIRQGKSGMRAWTPREQEIIKTSRSIRLRNFLSITAVLVLLGVGFFLYRLDWYRQEIDRALDWGPSQFADLEEIILDSPRIGKREALRAFNSNDENRKLRGAMSLATLDAAQPEHYAPILIELKEIDEPNEYVEFQNLKRILTAEGHYPHWENQVDSLTSPVKEADSSATMNHIPAVFSVLLAANQPNKIPADWYSPDEDPTVRTMCIQKISYWLSPDEIAEKLGIIREGLQEQSDEQTDNPDNQLNDNEQLQATLCLALSKFPQEQLITALSIDALVQKYQSANTSALHSACRVLLTKLDQFQAAHPAEEASGAANQIEVVAPRPDQLKSTEWVTLRFSGGIFNSSAGENTAEKSVLMDFVKISPPSQPAVWISATEVPNYLWRGFQLTHAEYCSSEYRLKNERDTILIEPGAYVTWTEALNFCNWLSHSANLKQRYASKSATEFACQRFTDQSFHNASANGFRLPTPQEWLFACAGQSNTAYHFGNDDTLLTQYDWYVGNSVRTTIFTPEGGREQRVIENVSHPVATKLPNPFGLFDMHGNLREWIWNDQNKKEEGQELRGGSFQNLPHFCITKDVTPNKLHNIPNNEYGLRLVLEKLPE